MPICKHQCLKDCWQSNANKINPLISIKFVDQIENDTPACIIMIRISAHILIVLRCFLQRGPKWVNDKNKFFFCPNRLKNFKQKFQQYIF